MRRNEEHTIESHQAKILETPTRKAIFYLQVPTVLEMQWTSGIPNFVGNLRAGDITVKVLRKQARKINISSGKLWDEMKNIYRMLFICRLLEIQWPSGITNFAGNLRAGDITVKVLQKEVCKINISNGKLWDEMKKILKNLIRLKY